MFLVNLVSDEGGALLLELNRVLRPGGYFVWSATPVYQKLEEDVQIWNGRNLSNTSCPFYHTNILTLLCLFFSPQKCPSSQFPCAGSLLKSTRITKIPLVLLFIVNQTQMNVTKKGNRTVPQCVELMMIPMPPGNIIV